MNKDEFICLLSKDCKISKEFCKKIIDCEKNIIFSSLRCGKEINFFGFGKFFVKCTNERLLKTKKGIMLVPSKSIAKFKISKSFRNSIY